MSISADKKITNVSAFFLEPINSTHRQYEALRAYYVDGLPSAEAARRFGYTPGSFRVLCHAFRQHPHRAFFRAAQKGPAVAPKRDRVREQVICLRKQNLSIYDISQALEESGHRLSPAAVSLILKQEGFARLPRRRDEERPGAARAELAAAADVRQLELAPRRFRTRFGGLFLFLPTLAAIPFDQLLAEIGFNRISVGVQDFDQDVQSAVNRIQSYEQTAAVVDAARAALSSGKAATVLDNLVARTNAA